MKITIGDIKRVDFKERVESEIEAIQADGFDIIGLFMFVDKGGDYGQNPHGLYVQIRYGTEMNCKRHNVFLKRFKVQGIELTYNNIHKKTAAVNIN